MVVIGNVPATSDLSVPNRTRYQAAPRPDEQGYARDGVGGQERSESDRLAQRKYQREWLAARRAAFFAGKTCALCDADGQLELDHLDKDQKVDHRIWSWSAERRAAEIAKCRVICRPCHTERHADERRSPLVHGTANAYKKKSCRCDVCRRWNAGYKAELTARGKAAA